MAPAARVGRPRVYCSQSCRQRAYERRAGDAPSPAGGRYRGTRGWLEALVERDKVCRLCKMPLDSSIKSGPLSPVTDHMIPTVWGGATHPDNLHAVHLVCNAQKGSRLVIDWNEVRHLEEKVKTLQVVQQQLPFEESA